MWLQAEQGEAVEGQSWEAGRGSQLTPPHQHNWHSETCLFRKVNLQRRGGEKVDAECLATHLGAQEWPFHLQSLS